MVCEENENDHSISFVILSLLPFNLRAQHSPVSSAKVKNGGAIPPFPHASTWNNA
jgi:hypothetical protein